MGSSLKSAQFLIESRRRDAARGDTNACYDLGIVYSSGSEGVDIDLIEAHKWFNIAAMSGSERAKDCRAEISEDMTAREILAAQKAARDWLMMTQRRAA
ncbi:sel1 repeat family protein [Sphingomonas sp. G-3-2-10]|uniref:sel1 repeat family protein n=1 Tax=Sphingomonas sp. G-3-2-10 TaxID=2728838 RepID=UPI001469DC17|nr:sel1 repeat family protein [Sphingomonas sp. G-3-2-10]NML06831.1 sel1 repeat family protein [Sphingomonas sp. G-3-2-10]